MTIYSNKNNPQFRVKLIDMFPTTVGSLSFNVSDTAENIVTADATFRFTYFEYERIQSIPYHSQHSDSTGKIKFSQILLVVDFSD